MTETTLRSQIAILQSTNDQLETEITQIDEMLRLVGFSEGLATFKAAAQELLQMQAEEQEE